MKRLDNNNQEFRYQMEFVECDIEQANRSVGTNALYSKNKGNTYFLLDVNGIPSNNTWNILTNNYRLFGFIISILIHLFRIKKYLMIGF